MSRRRLCRVILDSIANVLIELWENTLLSFKYCQRHVTKLLKKRAFISP
jgi:hypothetical protein